MTSLSEFWLQRRKYEELARKRADEYLNSPNADMSWGERVTTEMVIDVLNRMDKLEELLKPAPAEKADEELPLPAEKKGKSKFF
jgi:hypothetical protein